MSEVETEAPSDGAPETPSELADLGWLVVNDTPEELVVTSETQGEARLVPRSIRAEKQINSTLVSVEAATPELLQTRIESLEETRAASPPNGPLVLSVSGRPVSPEQPAEALETVITPEGNFTEAEWSQRGRSDTIVTAEGQQVFVGIVEDVHDTPPDEQINAIDEAYAAVDEVSQRIENARVHNPDDAVETKQVEYSTADSVDSPGQSAGGLIRIPDGFDDRSEAIEQMNERSQDAENERVSESDKIGRRPVDDIDLTGLDVGLGRHGDLGTENPPVGLTTEVAEAMPDIAETVASTEGPTRQAQRETEQVRLDAIMETRDQAEPGEIHSDAEAEKEALASEQAAAEADPSTPDEPEFAAETPPATAAAIQAADDLGVDLNEVEGTGTEGKITKADVEAAANG